MTSGLEVPKVSLAGNTTPTDLCTPSAVTKSWLTHLPSKYTLPAVVSSTPEYFSVMLIGFPSLDTEKTLDQRFGDKAQKAHAQCHEQPHRVVLSGLGLPRQIADDEQHVEDQRGQQHLQRDRLELGDREAEDGRRSLHAALLPAFLSAPADLG